MGKVVLITGGARSGKSTYAENKAIEYGQKVMYIATSIPFDEEMQDRVRKHKERRSKDWLTYEAYKDLKRVYDNNACFEVILLDCITVMVTNLLFDFARGDFEALTNAEINTIEKSIMEEVEDFISAARVNSQTVIIVTNELGSGIVPEYKSGRVFRDIAGRVNQFIASSADEVYLTVCGIPIKIK
jgi:adenosylcobinamide kinase / adenosylcobinamide-phosphate guanylyltransferase